MLALGLAALALLVATTLSWSPAEAQVPPFKAWGPGLKSGEVVRAFKGSAQVGQTTVTSAGTWEMDIQSAGAASVVNGDKITFTVEGRVAAESATFNIGQFVLPPGLTLTTAAAGTTPASTATATPVAAATNTADRGKLAGSPIFDSTGRALAVFNGGTVDELGAEGTRTNATGVWVQAPDGSFQLFVIGGPVFLNDQFRTKFPTGFAGFTSVLLVK